MSESPKAQPYLDRRGLLMEQLSKGLILVRGQAAGGVNPNFFYLTGLAAPEGILVLAPGGVRIGTGRAHPGRDYLRGRIAQQILFLPSRDPLAERWGEEASPTTADVQADQLGVDAVYALGEFPGFLASAAGAASRLFYVRSAPQSLNGPDAGDSELVGRLAQRFFHLRVEDGTPALEELRRIKDPAEISRIERSIAVTGEAIDRLLLSVHAGMQEHEAEAEIARIYRASGGTHAFEPIVACGANALKLHYTANASPIEPGRLLLIDTGVSIAGYKSDITRTIPVDGRFDKRQREIYAVVLDALEHAIAACRPGVTLGDVHAEAFDVIERAGFGSDFPHGIGHHLGLETHDVGDVHRPLLPGAVVTIEPGVYVASEGIGVRIEDDVLITDGGCRVLSEGIPRSIEAIEQRMAEGRRR